MTRRILRMSSGPGGSRRRERKKRASAGQEARAPAPAPAEAGGPRVDELEEGRVDAPEVGDALVLRLAQRLHHGEHVARARPARVRGDARRRRVAQLTTTHRRARVGGGQVCIDYGGGDEYARRRDFERDGLRGHTKGEGEVIGVRPFFKVVDGTL